MYWVIIDGYNVIKKSETLKRLQLRAAREKLKVLIKHKLSPKIKITIVFDSKQDLLLPYRKIQENIEEIFTQDQTADDYIKELISKSKNPKQITVITNDREILSFAKNKRTKLEKPELLLAKLAEKQSIPSDTLKNITPKQILKINQELKKALEKKLKTHENQ